MGANVACQLSFGKGGGGGGGWLYGNPSPSRPDIIFHFSEGGEGRRGSCDSHIANNGDDDSHPFISLLLLLLLQPLGFQALPGMVIWPTLTHKSPSSLVREKKETLDFATHFLDL